MQASHLTFFSLLIGTELFVVATFGLIFDKSTFYQLVSVSMVMCLVLGAFGVLRMRNEPVYAYRDALQKGYDRFNESL